jgi:hypothetical protein
VKESDLENLRSKLAGLAGVSLSDDEVAALLAEIVSGGGGVHIEIDDSTRYRLIRRDAKFVLTKESARARLSSVPPRR